MSDETVLGLRPQAALLKNIGMSFAAGPAFFGLAPRACRQQAGITENGRNEVEQPCICPGDLHVIDSTRISASGARHERHNADVGVTQAPLVGSSHLAPALDAPPNTTT